MEFLKSILGDGYAAFEASINAWNAKPENKDKQVKIADVGSGEYVSKKKYDALSVDKQNLEAQLQKATEGLKKFEGIDDPAKLISQVTNLQGELSTMRENYENQIADMKFSSVLDSAIASAGGRNAKAIQALLDIETMKKSKDQSADIAAAIEACKAENAYLFGANEPINNPTGPTGGSFIGLTKEQFQKMGYKERLELKQKDPAKYEEMKG